MKYLKSAIVIILGVSLVLILYYYFLQKKLIFYPSKTYAPPPAHLEIEEVFINTRDGERLHAWWLTTSQAEKTAFFFHGNAGNLTDRTFRLEIFKTLGLNALLFDYRGYGRSSGKIKTEQDLYIDGLAAWEFLTVSKKIAPEDIIIWGRSLGSGIAVEIAQNKDVASVVLEASLFSLPELARHYFWFLPTELILKFDFANNKKIKDIQAPILFVHSPADEVIPFQEGKKLFQVAPEPKTFLMLSGSHNTDIAESYESYLKGLRKFLPTTFQD